MPYSNVPESKWEAMDSCVESVMKKQGVEKERAIAICHSTIVGEDRQKEKSIALPGIITKAQRMQDGRVRWRARVNSGQFDQEGERFDRSYFEELVNNFAIQQEALSKRQSFPIEVKLGDGFVLMMAEPIQDIAHYSYFIDDRSKARTGYPTKLWLDGGALMSEGYYDNTPLGQLAAKAALAERDPEKRRMSLGTYPDWGLVEDLPDGRRVFKGGRGRAWLDHEAITSYPVDADTEIITLSEVKDMATQKQDALSVLGEEAEELVDELEKAKVKSKVDKAALLKGEDEEKEKEKKEKPEEEPEEKPEKEPEPAPQPSPEVEAAVKSLLTDFMPRFGDRIVEHVDATIKAQVGDRIEKLEARIEAVAADETAKVKAAMDNPESWIDALAEKSLSVQHGDEAVVKGEKVKEAPAGDFAQAWGNPAE